MVYNDSRRTSRIHVSWHCCMQSIHLFLLSLALSWTTNSLAESERAPNIVIFLSDDAGYADFGFQGSQKFETPNLDRLARQGTVFDNAYAGSAVCSPSRAGLLTGRHPARLGIEFNVSRGPGRAPDTERGLPEMTPTLAEHLSSAGYVNGFVGKWHLGSGSLFHPLNRGFDSFFGIVGGHSNYHPEHARRIFSGRKIIDDKQLPYLTDAFGDAALEFIDRHSKRPFYLQVSFTAPHPPMQALPEDLARFAGRLPSDKRVTNAAMMFRMDKNIGRIVDKVNELGLTNHTIFFFANDNGGDLRANGASNAPLNGDKGTLLEGGIKIPMILSWTRLGAGGMRTDELVWTLDIVPTALDAAEITGQDSNLEGFSLLPAALGNSRRIRRDRFFWRANWSAAIRHGEFKLIRTPLDHLLLFDLAQDPNELVNLIDTRPDLARRLQGELAEWEKGLEGPLWEMPESWKPLIDNRYHQ
jgi:arylsulfatase A-like enzyme